MELSFEAHAASARAACRADGMSDCIHYAPEWRGRADALYARLNELGDIPESVGLLADGRMVAVGRTCGVFEMTEVK